MTVSPDLQRLSGPKRRILMYLAVSEQRPGQSLAFPVFADGFRRWRQRSSGDSMINFCLSKFAEAKLITSSGTLASGDLTFAPTELGVRVAQEAYLLAERGVTGFAELLPAKLGATPETPTPTKAVGRLHVAITSSNQ